MSHTRDSSPGAVDVVRGGGGAAPDVLECSGARESRPRRRGRDRAPSRAMHGVGDESISKVLRGRGVRSGGGTEQGELGEGVDGGCGWDSYLLLNVF